MLPENLPEEWLLECFLPALYIHVHCIVYIHALSFIYPLNCVHALKCILML